MIKLQRDIQREFKVAERAMEKMGRGLELKTGPAELTAKQQLALARQYESLRPAAGVDAPRPPKPPVAPALTIDDIPDPPPPSTKVRKTPAV